MLITTFPLEKNFFLRRGQALYVTQSVEEHASPLDLQHNGLAVWHGQARLPHLQGELGPLHIKWDNMSLTLGKQ